MEEASAEDLTPGTQIFILRSGVLVHVLPKLHAKRGQKKLQRFQWADCSLIQPKPTCQPQLHCRLCSCRENLLLRKQPLSYLQTLETLTSALYKDSKVFLYTRTAMNRNMSEMNTCICISNRVLSFSLKKLRLNCSDTHTVKSFTGFFQILQLWPLRLLSLVLGHPTAWRLWPSLWWVQAIPHWSRFWQVLAALSNSGFPLHAGILLLKTELRDACE